MVTFKSLGETRTKTEDVCRLESYILGKDIRKFVYDFMQHDFFMRGY